MPKGMLSVSYDLAVPNFVVLDPGPFTQRVAGPPPWPRPWTATLKPADAGLELVIEIETDDPSSTVGVADQHARSIAEYLTFWLCDYDISHRVIPKRVASSFQSAEPNTLHVLSVEVILVGEAPTVVVTRRVKGQNITGALADFSLRQRAPTPVWANDLVIARQMFIAGLSVENRVASFLITYAAAAVFARFKTHAGKLQGRIDAVLTTEDQTIRTFPRITTAGKTVLETEFTAARNIFIHSEDRGRDPAAAMAKIESLAPRFQTLVGRILRKG
jgi:hypothetical protein